MHNEYCVMYVVLSDLWCAPPVTVIGHLIYELNLFTV